MEAYQKGGMVAAEINGILAAEFCHELLAPVVETYDNEKARILGDEGGIKQVASDTLLKTYIGSGA